MFRFYFFFLYIPFGLYASRQHWPINSLALLHLDVACFFPSCRSDSFENQEKMILKLVKTVKEIIKMKREFSAESERKSRKKESQQSIIDNEVKVLKRHWVTRGEKDTTYVCIWYMQSFSTDFCCFCSSSDCNWSVHYLYLYILILFFSLSFPCLFWWKWTFVFILNEPSNTDTVFCGLFGILDMLHLFGKETTDEK